MKIDPDHFYPADAAELAPLGKPQTRARHRHEGIGCPYVKVGSRVFYQGSDVLAYLEARRVKTQRLEAIE